MLKVAEAKVVDGIVKKVAKGTKQSKIPTKATNRTKEPTVPKKTHKKRNLQYNRSWMMSKIMTTSRCVVQKRIIIMIDLIVLRKS